LKTTETNGSIGSTRERRDYHIDYLEDMNPTEQEKVRRIMRKQYGPTGFTQDHINFKLVGFDRPEGKRVSGAGSSWAAAMAELARKAEK
jgi:hypothetical protein